MERQGMTDIYYKALAAKQGLSLADAERMYRERARRD